MRWVALDVVVFQGPNLFYGGSFSGPKTKTKTNGWDCGFVGDRTHTEKASQPFLHPNPLVSVLAAERVATAEKAGSKLRAILLQNA